jgi:hypothetical protein
MNGLDDGNNAIKRKEKNLKDSFECLLEWPNLPKGGSSMVEKHQKPLIYKGMPS